MPAKGEVRPITPKDVAEEKLRKIPDVVIEVVNQLLKENIRDGSATISEEDIVDRLVEKGVDPNEIYKCGWLDFEPIYRNAGWKVTCRENQARTKNIIIYFE